MEQEGEKRSTADTARESRQHEERAAGPAAQFTHHETASTQERHTAPAATHHAAGEDIHHHRHPAHLYSQREMAKTRGHHTTHTERAHTTPVTTASGPSAISDAAPKLPAIPPSMECGAQLNAVTRGAPHPQERTLGLRTPSLLPSPHGHGRRQQPPHATASMHYKRSIQIHCNVNLVCACRNKRKEVEKREQSMWREAQTKIHSGDTWRKQQEVDRSNS
ncbi:hypothetical protein MOQ_006897 [Trypanosoma cruzi marinkellei]|uniref:Uncharacterized protein n=1 Tax=Trypanosoma cruzi marinkellei TaxID=85056 RepID=K2N3S9_TRYCR|nr:hypothetical protein MOQ_006897 [Trypanosoma cruzi marinkellei]